MSPSIEDEAAEVLASIDDIERRFSKEDFADFLEDVIAGCEYRLEAVNEELDKKGKS